MRARTTRKLKRWLKDMALGAAIFILLPLLALAAPRHHAGKAWTFDEAFAGEVIATRAIEVTSPASVIAENAIVGAALMRPAGALLGVRHISDLVVLGVTFSLLFAMNLAFWRHLRRVSASPRQRVWRRPT